jgi:hypothetical protein
MGLFSILFIYCNGKTSVSSKEDKARYDGQEPVVMLEEGSVKNEKIDD